MQSRRREAKHKGISRMDFARAKGWFVRVYRQGKTHAKFFSDSGYDGKEQALRQAIAYKMEYERHSRRRPLKDDGRRRVSATVSGGCSASAVSHQAATQQHDRGQRCLGNRSHHAHR